MRNQIIRTRESLALYKSYNTLWYIDQKLFTFIRTNAKRKTLYASRGFSFIFWLYFILNLFYSGNQATYRYFLTCPFEYFAQIIQQTHVRHVLNHTVYYHLF
jgi:hypothetical protein